MILGLSLRFLRCFRNDGWAAKVQVGVSLANLSKEASTGDDPTPGHTKGRDHQDHHPRPQSLDHGPLRLERVVSTALPNGKALPWITHGMGSLVVWFRISGT